MSPHPHHCSSVSSEEVGFSVVELKTNYLITQLTSVSKNIISEVDKKLYNKTIITLQYILEVILESPCSIYKGYIPSPCDHKVNIENNNVLKEYNGILAHYVNVLVTIDANAPPITEGESSTSTVDAVIKPKDDVIVNISPTDQFIAIRDFNSVLVVDNLNDDITQFMTRFINRHHNPRNSRRSTCVM